MKGVLFVFGTSWASCCLCFGQVVNGDFESPDIAPPYVTYGTGFSIPGWEVYDGTVDLVDMAQFSSSQILDLNGSGPGAIRQTLSTVAGQKYQLSLTWQPNTVGAGSPLTRIADLDWNGVNYGRFQHDGTPHSETDSFVFLATGSDVLSLISQNSTSAGIMFDDITLVAVGSQTPLSPVLGNSSPSVPEPATYAFIFSVGLLAFASVDRLRDNRACLDRKRHSS